MGCTRGFVKGQVRNIFGFMGFMGPMVSVGMTQLCCHVRDCTWLCPSQTLFTEIGSGLYLACGL